MHTEDMQRTEALQPVPYWIFTTTRSVAKPGRKRMQDLRAVEPEMGVLVAFSKMRMAVSIIVR